MILGPRAPWTAFAFLTVRPSDDIRADSIGTPRRGLGWDIPTPQPPVSGERCFRWRFGHTGWTGTSLWIDPFSRTFVILFRIETTPPRDGNVLPPRKEVRDAGSKAVRGFDFASGFAPSPSLAKVPAATPRPSPKGRPRC